MQLSSPKLPAASNPKKKKNTKDKTTPPPPCPSIFSCLPLFLSISLHNQIQPNVNHLSHPEATTKTSSGELKTSGDEVKQQRERGGYYGRSFPRWFEWRPPHLSSIFFYFWKGVFETWPDWMPSRFPVQPVWSGFQNFYTRHKEDEQKLTWHWNTVCKIWHK